MVHGRAARNQVTRAIERPKEPGASASGSVAIHMTTFTRSLALATLLAAVGAAFLLSSNTRQVNTGSRISPQPAPVEGRRLASVDDERGASSLNRQEGDVRVARKYRYLLEPMSEDRSTHALALLEARERAGDENASAEELANLESDLIYFLEPSERDFYLALRDSDADQRALDDFLAGVSSGTPIADAERRELLLTKLHHKSQFQQWRVQSSLNLDTLSTEEREYAHALLERALNEYRTAYLLDMRSRLDEERFQRLSDYEHTEFALELERLQQEVNAK